MHACVPMCVHVFYRTASNKHVNVIQYLKPVNIIVFESNTNYRIDYDLESVTKMLHQNSHGFYLVSFLAGNKFDLQLKNFPHSLHSY